MLIIFYVFALGFVSLLCFKTWYKFGFTSRLVRVISLSLLIIIIFWKEEHRGVHSPKNELHPANHNTGDINSK